MWMRPNSMWMRSCQGMGIEKVCKDDTAHTFEFPFRFNRVWINSRLLLLLFALSVLQKQMYDTLIESPLTQSQRLEWSMVKLNIFSFRETNCILTICFYLTMLHLQSSSSFISNTSSFFHAKLGVRHLPQV